MKTALQEIIACVILFTLFLAGCTPESALTIKDGLALKNTCVISGNITDQTTHKPIKDASVVVFSKPISTVTDLYGQYQFIDLPPGVYTLQVFCVGYIQKDIPDVAAKPNRFIILNVELEPRETRSE